MIIGFRRRGPAKIRAKVFGPGGRFETTKIVFVSTIAISADVGLSESYESPRQTRFASRGSAHTPHDQSPAPRRRASFIICSPTGLPLNWTSSYLALMSCAFRWRTRSCPLGSHFAFYDFFAVLWIRCQMAPHGTKAAISLRPILRFGCDSGRVRGPAPATSCA